MKNSKVILLLVTLCFLADFATAQSTFVDTANIGDNAKAGHYLKIRGFTLYYESYGAGEPLLLIHGNGGSISNFMYQVPFFSKNYRVIVADSRAQGKSVDPGDSLSYEMMADDLNALLDALHTGPCYVIGWSDGGINGLLLSIRHPDKVKKLAVTGARLWTDSTSMDAQALNWALNYNASFERLKQTAETRNKSKVAHLLTDDPHLSAAQLQKIQCPTLVIAGDHDIILPRHTLLIAASIPKSYCWIFPDSGNSIPVYYKDSFNDGISQFLQKPYRKIDGTDRFN